MCAPSPVRPRRTSAASTPEYAYIPAAMSAVGIPVFAGASGVPVIDTRPPSLCTSRSYARLSRYGPDEP
jgi:hypothetical protein